MYQRNSPTSINNKFMQQDEIDGGIIKRNFQFPPPPPLKASFTNGSNLVGSTNQRPPYK
jgi:hypothetical protein